MLDFLFGEKVVKTTTIKKETIQTSKRMYSEEEVENMLYAREQYLIESADLQFYDSISEWFEQFKKK
jgi:hypothetical protein